MTAGDIAAIVSAAVAFLTLFGTLLALVFNVGSFKGQMSTFMQTAERDRAETLKDIGRLEERLERHVESRHGGS